MPNDSDASERRVWLVVLGVLIVVGTSLRVTNAFSYLVYYGYDAVHNWEYIVMLRESWRLPAPDAGWSTPRPPLFYYIAAAVARLFDDDARRGPIIAIRLLSSFWGLAAILLSLDLIRRGGASLRRIAIAAGLLLLLPAHLVLSAMLNEEILLASLSTLAIYLAARAISEKPDDRSLRRPLQIGLVGGLAFLTKLTGSLAAAASGLSLAISSLRRDRGAARASRQLAVVGGVSLAVGGWFYLRSLLVVGALQAHGMPAHELMFTMPPGERELLDYLRVPLATFIDPRATHPDLLRSVWGTTYASLWFDAHRHFIPLRGAAIRPMSALILVLGAIPTAAFALGFVRGVRRALANERGPDSTFVLFVTITVVGFVLYTWRNPWFATTKGSYLLGLALPFAYYASEVLDEWLSPSKGRMRALACTSALALLAGALVLAFSFETPLWDWGPIRRGPGLRWTAVG